MRNVDCLNFSQQETHGLVVLQGHHGPKKQFRPVPEFIWAISKVVTVDKHCARVISHFGRLYRSEGDGQGPGGDNCAFGVDSCSALSVNGQRVLLLVQTLALHSIGVLVNVAFMSYSADFCVVNTDVPSPHTVPHSPEKPCLLNTVCIDCHLWSVNSKDLPIQLRSLYKCIMNCNIARTTDPWTEGATVLE